MLLDDILARLVAAGVVDGSSTWEGRINYMPESPNQLVCLYELASEPAEQEWSIDYPEFQIVIRGDEYGSEDARTEAQDVFNALQSQEALVGATYVYLYCNQSGPFYVGPDVQNRPKFQMTFSVMKSR